MAQKTDDVVPNAYKYSWKKDSDLSLDEFLRKFRPSMVQNDGTKPWIWVERAPGPGEQSSGMVQAIAEGTDILNELTEKVESIKNDDTIPLRSNKKTGAKSKKEVREAAQAEATKQLETISIKHGFVSGKWLVFAPADRVDVVWSTVATSLVSGPLASTCAHCAKVATSPENEPPNYQHIICIYVPDVYDKPKVVELMKVLLRQHGLNLSGVKSNLYTYLGIDSKHPSGIQSTVWKNSALLPDAESKALKEAHFADLANKSSQGEEKKEDKAAEDEPTAAQDDEPSTSKAKTKPKPKKKGKRDPFASDDEGEGEKAEEAPKSKGKLVPKKKGMGDPFTSSDEEGKSKSEAPAPAPAKPKPKPKKKAKGDAFASSDEGEAPAKSSAVGKKAAARKRKESSDAEDEAAEGKAKKTRVGR